MKLANVLLIIISLISVIIFLKIGIKNTGNWRFYSSLFGMIGGCITGAKIGATGGTVALPGIGTITGVFVHLDFMAVTQKKQVIVS